MEMNSIPWSPVLRYATPLPINRTPVSTVGGPFPPFCCTPDPSQSIGPRSECWRSVSSVVRYARPRFHHLFRPSPPDGHDHAFRSDPAGWLPRISLPPDEHNAFRCLPMNTTHFVASPRTRRIPLPPHEHDAVSPFRPSRLASDEEDTVAAVCGLSRYTSPGHTYARVRL